MIGLTTIFTVLLFHWLGDFFAQTYYQSINKSKKFSVLLKHTSIYSMIVTLGVFLFSAIPLSLIAVGIFFAVTLLTHTATDFITSRINSYFWNKGDMHNFFVSVGFDQLLHYVTLFVTVHLINTSL